MILDVYLGHRIFHPVVVLFFSTSVFGGRLKLPKLRGSIGKKVANLYRSPRLESSKCYRFTPKHDHFISITSNHATLVSSEENNNNITYEVYVLCVMKGAVFLAAVSLLERIEVLGSSSSVPTADPLQ